MKQIIQKLKDWWRGVPLGAMGRSSQWPKTRKAFLLKHPNCEVCGTKGSFLKPNEVHHIESYATRPDLELSGQNLITGCREHHQWFYHLGSFKSLNENVREDVKIWAEKIKNRPTWENGKWNYPK